MSRDSVRWVVFALVVGLVAGSGYAQAPGRARREAKANANATASPSTGHFEITGVVINTVSGSPVPHCHMTPNLNAPRGGFGNRQFPASANGFDCDERGRFVVTVPSAGSWHLTASARGFVSAAYDEHAPYSSAVVLTAEAPTKDLEFRLSPEASIIGQVLDEAGEPVRNAQVMLQAVPPPSPGGPPAVGQTRGNARTDDRGMYELANLAPGSYRLTVRAQPWYAANAQQIRTTDTDTTALDPSLDYAYPVTWFPGVSDPAIAETIVLHAGDTRQADFHMIPIPSIHLRIVAPPRVNTGPNQTGPPMFPIVQQMNSGGGGQSFTQVTSRIDPQGQIDVGGLTPGTYEVRLAGPNQEGRAALVEVSANSTRTLDLSAPSREMARVSVHIDGLEDSDSTSRQERGGGVQVTLIDTDSRRGSVFSNGIETTRPTFARRDQRDPNGDRVMEVPPGRYEVVLQGRANIFLTGLTAKGAETAGRYVTVGPGESSLTVHAASGRASLSGIATMDGKPSVGAMVLLVPITIEDPNSINLLRQDQTNTDGSFDIANVLPGQYILVAIDHGWQINWGDPSTLRRYLMQGVPLELKPSAIVKQNVPAQAP